MPCGAYTIVHFRNFQGKSTPVYSSPQRLFSATYYAPVSGQFLGPTKTVFFSPRSIFLGLTSGPCYLPGDWGLYAVSPEIWRSSHCGKRLHTFKVYTKEFENAD